MKRSTRSRPSDRQPPSVPGAILSDALYRLDEAAARMGWGAHAMRAASADDQSTEVDQAAAAVPRSLPTPAGRSRQTGWHPSG